MSVSMKLPPYARALGIAIDRDEGGVPVLALDPGPRVQGRPGYLHGGAISGLLEMAAILAVRAELAKRNEGAEQGPRLKPVNISVEFQRGGRMERCYAIGRVTRAGRRIVNVTAEAWQDDPAKPVAEAWMNILLAPPRDG